MSDEPGSVARFAAVPLAEPGTPARVWEDACSRLPVLSTREWDRVVVVVAHPDDEVLGAGQLLAHLAAAGAEVRMIIASDGEGAQPDAGAGERTELARVRRDESERAAETLGVPAPRFLHLPDGALADHERDLADAISEAVADLTNTATATAPSTAEHGDRSARTVVLTHWMHDGHPDHEAVGRAAASAAGRLRVQGGQVGLAAFPVWALHWDSPESGVIPMERAVRVTASSGDLARKRRAGEGFRSQLRPWPDEADRAATPPVLPAHVVQRLVERTEFVILEPADEHPMDVQVDSRAHLTRLYERAEDPWNLEGSPYEAAKRRATLAALPRERYRFCFEPGCSIGVLTAELARVADRVEAWEPVARPLALARDRAAALERSGGVAPGRIRLSQDALTASGPEPRFGPEGADLLVLSEMLYFIPHDELDAIVGALVDRAAPGAHVVAVHWRHPVSGWPRGGADTHRALFAVPALRHLSRDDRSPDYLIDVFEVSERPRYWRVPSPRSRE